MGAGEGGVAGDKRLTGRVDLVRGGDGGHRTSSTGCDSRFKPSAMLSLAELLFPITPATFFADYYGRKPLHIPAVEGTRKRELLTWDAWNHLLNQPGMWTSQTLRPVRDNVPVHPDQYCRTVQTVNGPVSRPWMPKLDVFLSSGASLVANDVHHLHPPVTRLAAMLGETFAAAVGSNVYFSSEGIRAFGSHYDTHEVFAVQTEGEKTWNLFAGRAENPVDSLPDSAEARRWLEQTRGALVQEVRMQAGDLLYVPRGCYHDALATDGPSLHVTLGVNPLDGRSIMSLLGLLAQQSPLFRDWLPSAQLEGGEPLKARLKALGQLLAECSASPALAEEIGRIQQRKLERPVEFSLPRLTPISLYRTTGRAFPETNVDIRVTYDWAIAQRQFAATDMVAHFDVLSEAQVRAGLAAAEAAGAVQKV